MAMRVGPDTGNDVPGTLWVVAVRVAVLAVVVAIVHLGLEESSRPTLAVVLVGAAWLLGRVD
jgi:hypothetical protein